MSLAASARAKEAPASIALADDETELSWAELDEILNRAANALLQADLGAERRVAVFAHNSVEAVTAYLAGLHAGVSSAPISFHFTVDELAKLLEEARAEALFVGPETAETGLAAARLAGVGLVVGWRCPDLPGLMAWTDWLGTADPGEPPTDAEPRPYLHFTSGTTGRPKCVETPPNMFPRVADLAGFFERLRADAAAGPPGFNMVVGPLYHTGPLTSVRALGGGTPVVIARRFDAEKILGMIERYRVASTVMVPTHFQRLLALPDPVRSRYDLSSLMMVGHTGAACPRDVKRQMIEWFGPVLVEAYGGTESGTTNMITSAEWLERPGSVGKALPQFDVVVVGENGDRLPPGQAGQLYFRDREGRGIVYHHNEEGTRAAHLEPAVFTLGDVGYVDEEGYVFITDRASDMIVSGGVNIYPAEAEQVLIQHPGVADIAVIGVPDEEMGEGVKALVVPVDPARPPSADELGAFCRSQLSAYKCPRSFDFVESVGRNPMGKVNKRALRAPYWPAGRTIGG